MPKLKENVDVPHFINKQTKNSMCKTKRRK
jgi:hypothetical protein